MCRRGTDTRRLLGYLFTEGLAGERGLDSAHVYARVIAGYQAPSGLEPDRRADGRADVSRLAALLDAPVRAGGVGKDAKPTYHLAISAAPTDRLLSDAEWADITELYVDRLGLAERGDSDAVRWVAVRHADNHVHVVATLVRQDGRRVFPHHDFYRAREASLAVERKYGLRPTSQVDRTADPETTRAEQRKHQGAVRASAQAGLPPPTGPDREVLRSRARVALAGSDGWEDFADRLRSSGVLVRERYSTRAPDEITGYAVGLPTTGVRDATGQQTVWFGGGKLAPDLSLPQLRARWNHQDGTSPETGNSQPSVGRAGRPRPRRQTGAPPGPAADLSDLDRRRLWVAAENAVRHADEHIRQASSHPSDAAAQATAQAAAAAAAEVLSAVSWLVERKRGGPLHAAAEDYSRAARDLHRRTVPASGRSRSTRTAAGALVGALLVRRAETRQLLSLLARLTALSESLALLRETQGRAAQAVAARRAAERLAGEHLRRSGAASAAVSTASGRVQRRRASTAAPRGERPCGPRCLTLPVTEGRADEGQARAGHAATAAPGRSSRTPRSARPCPPSGHPQPSHRAATTCLPTPRRDRRRPQPPARSGTGALPSAAPTPPARPPDVHRRR